MMVTVASGSVKMRELSWTGLLRVTVKNSTSSRILSPKIMTAEHTRGDSVGSNIRISLMTVKSSPPVYKKKI
jgi:hypothetical protein